MTPHLAACVFGEERMWARLARVLAYSAETYCSGWAVRIEALPAPPRSGPRIANTEKLAHWTQRVVDAPDGTCLLLLDADTLICRPIDALWARPFDLAITVRPRGFRLPLNAGVVAVRVSDRIRRLMEAWREENAQMLVDAGHHRTWARRYGGINQAALGCVLESSAVMDSLLLAELPCREWNCEDSSWSSFDPAVTRILHIKSRLRRAVFEAGRDRQALRPLVELWRGLEAEAAAAAEVGT